MAKKKKDDGGEPKPPGKAKAAMVPVGIFLAGIIVGQKVLGGGGTTVVQSADAAATEEEHTTDTTVPEGETLALGDTTVTLADGAQLKFGITVQLVPEEMVAEEEVAAESGGHGETATTEAVVTAEEPAARWTKAMAIASAVFGALSKTELQSPEGRSHAFEQVTEHLRAAYPEEVEEVYINPFVMA